MLIHNISQLSPQNIFSNNSLFGEFSDILTSGRTRQTNLFARVQILEDNGSGSVSVDSGY